MRLRNSKVALADFRISFDLAPGTPLGDVVEGSFFMEPRRFLVGKWGKFKGVAIQINTDPAGYPVMGFSESVLVGEMVVYSPPPSCSSSFENQ